MLGSDGDLVAGRSDRLPVFPLLLVGDQSSLHQNVVEEDIHDNVVPGVDLSGDFPAAADDVLGIELEPSSAAPALVSTLFFVIKAFLFPS